MLREKTYQCMHVIIISCILKLMLHEKACKTCVMVWDLLRHMNIYLTLETINFIFECIDFFITHTGVKHRWEQSRTNKHSKSISSTPVLKW